MPNSPKLHFLAFAAAVLALSSTAHAKVDLSSYNLTAKQIETIQKFEAKGYNDDFIRKMAQAFHNTNEKQANPIYIPPHTLENLYALTNWAGIGPFNELSKHTPYEFDLERYHADCPNWALFNFARATGTQFLRVDVLNKALNSGYSLSKAHALDQTPGKTEFLKYFEEMADVYGARPYLSLRKK